MAEPRLDAVYSRSQSGSLEDQAWNEALQRNGLGPDLNPIQPQQQQPAQAPGLGKIQFDPSISPEERAMIESRLGVQPGGPQQERMSLPDAATRSAARIAQQKQLMKQEAAGGPSFMRDVVMGTGRELVRGVVGGAQDASKELLESADSLAKWVGKITGTKSGGAFGTLAGKVPELVGENVTPGGKLLRGVSQFATGYAAGGTAVKGAGKGAALLKGMFSDAAAFDPNDPNISNMLNDLAPGLANPISEFLATNPNDNEALNRFKRAAEGAGLGVALDGIVALAKNLRARKAISAAPAEAPRPTSAAVQPTPGKTVDEIAENALREEKAAFILTSEKESPEVSAEVMGRGRQFLQEQAMGQDIRAAQEATLSETGNEIVQSLVKKARPELEAIAREMTPEAPEVGAEVMRRGKEFLGKPAIEVRALNPGEDGLFLGDKLIRRGSSADMQVLAKEINANPEKYLKPKGMGEKGEISPEVLHGIARAAVGGALGITQGDTMEERVTNALLAAGLGAAAKPSLIKKLIPALERIAPTEMKIAKSFDVGGQAKKVKPQGPVTVASEAQAKEFLAANPDALPAGKRAFKVNWSEVGSQKDIDDVLKVAENLNEGSIDVARRGVQSDEKRRQLASMLGMTEEEMLTRRRGQALNSETTQAYIDVYASATNELDRLAKAVKAGEPVENQFRLHLGRTTALTDTMMGAKAEAGRSLRVWGQAAQPIVRPGGIPMQAVDLAGKSIDEIPTEQLADMVLKLSSPAQKSVFMQYASRMKGAVLEYWTNALLSNPVTHAANAVSNAMTIGVSLAERAIAPAFGKEIVRGEASAMMTGLSGGWMDALTLAKKTWATGESQIGFGKLEARPRQISAENLGLTGPIGRAVDMLGVGINAPGRALLTADDFFKAINYRMELHAQALRQAASEGLSGPALQKRMTALAGDLDFNSLVKDQAENFAAYQTFNNALGEFGSGYIKWLDHHPMIRFVTPFVRTPVNIAKYTLERTPLVNLLMDSMKNDLAAGGARRQMALAKTAFGGLTYATAATLAYGGFITGGGPLDPDLKAIKRQTGWQPYSVKIGDTYYSYKRVDPLGFMLGLAADMTEKIGELSDLDASSLGMAGVVAFKDTFMDKTYLDGVQNVFEAINDKNGKVLSQYFNRLVGSFVPAGMAQITRQLDPTIKEINSAADAIYARLPGFSESVPARRNLWGEKIMLEGALGPDAISPFYTTSQKSDPVSDEMVRLESSIAMPPNYIFGTRPTDSPFAKEDPRRGVRLLPEEYARYTELAGQPAHAKLTEVIQTDTYKRLSDFDKKTILEQYVTVYRKEAQNKVTQEFPDLKAAIANKVNERIQAHQPVQ
jgi:hypothetical protein